MNPFPAIPGRLRLPFETSGAAPTSTAAPVSPVSPVQVVRVVERLSEDSYRVAVEGRTVSVRLAGTHDPGRILALAFTEPLPDADPAPEISSAARTALALGPLVADSEGGAMLEPVVVMVDAPGAGTALADELAGRIVRSGLFYESHLADWVEGKAPLEAIAREPQARFGETMAALPAPVDVLPAAAAKDAASVPVPAPLEPIVREQLATLERHEARFALPWGEGRPAELVVAREPGGRDEAGDAEGAWTTRIKLDLPHLGEVTARLRLMGRSVSLDFEAEDAMTDTLVDDLRALRARLAAHELNVSRLVIGTHG